VEKVAQWKNKDILPAILLIIFSIPSIIGIILSSIYELPGWVDVLFKITIVVVPFTILTIILFFRERKKEEQITTQDDNIEDDLPDDYVIHTNNFELYLDDSKQIEIIDEEIIKPIFVGKDQIPSNAFCSISKTHLEKSESILQCPICENYYLERYLLSWLENNDNCPVCKTKLITKPKEKLTAEEILRLIR
jgi:hypothetical protein